MCTATSGLAWLAQVLTAALPVDVTVHVCPRVAHLQVLFWVERKGYGKIEARKDETDITVFVHRTRLPPSTKKRQVRRRNASRPAFLVPSACAAARAAAGTWPVAAARCSIPL